MARIFPSALARGRYFIPQSVAMVIRSGEVWAKALRTRSATSPADSTSWSDRSMTPRMMCLVAEVLQHAEIETRLRGLDRDLVGRAAGQLGEERVPLRPVVDDRGVPEADVHGGGAGDTVQRGVECGEAVLAGRLGPGLHVRLVDLDHVGAGGMQVLDLGVDRGGVRQRRRLEVGVVLVLRLLRHRERAGHGHLDHVVGVRLQELHVADADRLWPRYRASDPWHRVGMPAAIEGRPGVVDVDALERGGEVVAVGLAPHLAVGDDVEPGLLLGADGQHRGVVLRLREVLRIDPPQLQRSHPRREAAGELGPVDQPVRLGVAPHQRGRQDRQRGRWCGHSGDSRTAVGRGHQLRDESSRPCGDRLTTPPRTRAWSR